MPPRDVPSLPGHEVKTVLLRPMTLQPRNFPSSPVGLSLDFVAHSLPSFLPPSHRPTGWIRQSCRLGGLPAGLSHLILPFLFLERAVFPRKLPVFQQVLASPFGRAGLSQMFQHLQSRYQQSCMRENPWESRGREFGEDKPYWVAQVYWNHRRLLQTKNTPGTPITGYGEGFLKNFYRHEALLSLSAILPLQREKPRLQGSSKLHNS